MKAKPKIVISERVRRQIIHLWDDGWTPDEIAQQLGIDRRIAVVVVSAALVAA